MTIDPQMKRMADEVYDKFSQDLDRLCEDTLDTFGRVHPPEQVSITLASAVLGYAVVVFGTLVKNGILSEKQAEMFFDNARSRMK